MDIRLVSISFVLYIRGIQGNANQEIKSGTVGHFFILTRVYLQFRLFGIAITQLFLNFPIYISQRWEPTALDRIVPALNGPSGTVIFCSHSASSRETSKLVMCRGASVIARWRR